MADTDKTYEELRDEWSSSGIVRVMAEHNLGKVCYNCGSTENVELHHIVPLKCGGTNSISNIAVLCHRCHMAAHHGRHIRDYCNKKVSGRPKSASDDEIAEALKEYTGGLIGAAEFKARVGLSESSHIADRRYYKDFLKEHNIKSFKNHIDLLLNKRGRLKRGDKVCTILYVNGDVKELYLA